MNEQTARPPTMAADAAAPGQQPIVITICTTCRQVIDGTETRPGPALLAEVAAMAGPAMVVRGTQCLSVCKRPGTAALSGPGRYTFLFGDLDPARDAGALVEMAAAMAGQPYGFVPWKARPENLRSRIIARIPPLEWAPEDGAAPA